MVNCIERDKDMVEIIFRFPVEEDAHKAFMSMSNFFQGSNVFINNYIIINPVKKVTQENDRPYWKFEFDISSGEDDTTIDKFKVITCGQLDLINGARKIWAIS